MEQQEEQGKQKKPLLLPKNLPKKENEELKNRKFIPSSPRGLLGLLSFSRQYTSLGLDIGKSFIRFVELGVANNSLYVYNFGGRRVDGQNDREALAQVISQLFEESGVRKNRAIIAVNNEDVIIRHLEFPRMNRRELERVFSLQGERFTSLLPEKAQIDFVIKNRILPTKKDKMSVMVVAAPNEVIERLLWISRKARVKPQVIDLESLAVIRALKRLNPNLSSVPNLAVINLGSETTDLVFYEHGYPYLTRVINIGMTNFITPLSLATQGEESVAERLVWKYGVVPDSPIWSYIAEHVQRLFDEISSSLGYYQTREGRQLDRICFTGRGARLKGLVPCFEELASETLYRYSQDGQAPVVEAVNPEKILKFHPRLKGPEILGPEYILALGLALRPFERGRLGNGD